MNVNLLQHGTADLSHAIWAMRSSYLYNSSYLISLSKSQYILIIQFKRSGDNAYNEDHVEISVPYSLY